MADPERLTVAEQLDAAQTGEEFGNVILGLFSKLESMQSDPNTRSIYEGMYE